MAIFGRKPISPGPCPTDRVVPLHFFENSLLVQGNNMAVSLVFDDVLDPEKLRQSLEGLIQRDGWQRLGGRLRRNVPEPPPPFPGLTGFERPLTIHHTQAAGSIEWHIPTEFTSSRPALNYSYVDHGIPAATHPAARRIPAPSLRPSVVGDPDELAPLAWDPDYKPGGISDYIDTDMPVLGLRIHSFTDKTVAVLQWQHVAFDALGMQYVVENWSRMLWGRQDEVPMPCGLDGDPFAALAKGTRPVSEKHLLADRRVGLGGMLKWGLGYGVDMLVRAKENRMVCVPRSYWQPQLEKALAELRAEAREKGEGVDKVFLTEGDILTAWTLRCVVRPLGMNPERTVGLAFRFVAVLLFGD